MASRSNRRRPGMRRGSASAALFALVCASVGAAVYYLAVRTALGQEWDDRLRGGLTGAPSRAGSTGSDLLNTISVGTLALAGGVIIVLALSRRRPRLAVGAACLILGANLTTQWLKSQLDRPRLTSGWWTDAGSFPSGHATVACSLTFAAVLVAPAALRVTVAVFGGAYTLAVGVAVIGLSWHRLSDVLGAYLVTAVWCGLVIWALSFAPDSASARGRISRRSQRWGIALAIGAGVAAFGFALREVGDVDPEGLWHRRADLLVVAGISAVTLAVLLTVVVRLSMPASVGVSTVVRRT